MKYTLVELMDLQFQRSAVNLAEINWKTKLTKINICCTLRVNLCLNIGSMP